MILRVFISYKFQDTARNDWVDKLYKDLRDIGIDAKLYNYEVALGESFSDYMARGIRECDYFLFIITPEAVKAVESGKGAVAFEMQIANARRMKDGLKVIPIFREGTETSTYLLDHRYLDFRNDDNYDSSFAELLQWLFGKIKPPNLGDISFESERDAINYAREIEKSARQDFNIKKYAEALKKIKTAVHLDLDDVSILGLYGRILTDLGKFDDAISPLTKAIEKTQFGSNKRIYLKNRLLSNYFRRKYDLAIMDGDIIIESSPKNKEGHRLRATTWIVLGDLEKALQDINIAVEENDYLSGHAIKAVVLNKIGDITGAQAEIKTCEELKPKDGVDSYCVALAYATLGNLDMAFNLLEKSISADLKCKPRAEVEPLLSELRINPKFDLILSRANSSPSESLEKEE